MIGSFDEEDCDIIIELARELTGTNVNKNHHSVIIQNVSSRMRQIGCEDLESYLQYVDQVDAEMSYFISALTIHTTSWFREIGAFEKFEDIIKSRDKTKAGIFRVLSIACSTGEEPYSLGAVLESVRRSSSFFEYSIEGWDIDPVSLQEAIGGVYEAANLSPVPNRFLSFLGKKNDNKFFVHSDIKNRSRFRTVNIANPISVTERFDFIICRNVFIYFDAMQINKIMKFIRTILAQDGVFCTGVSETGAVDSSLFTPVGNALYKAKDSVVSTRVSLPYKDSAQKIQKDSQQNIILVVDDEMDLRALLLETLAAAGFNALSASSAEEALKVIERRKIDLILCDQQMNGGMSGVELCKKLRQTGHHENFVLLSGFADKKLTEESFAAGCHEVIRKPLLGEELVRLAKHYVKVTDNSSGFNVDLILLGSSTGGTEILIKMLHDMPKNCPPVVIVQHITSGFAVDFAKRLALSSRLILGEIVKNEPLLNGHLYMALGDYHIGVKQVVGQLRLDVSDESAINGHRPSVDYLFQSAALTNQKIFAVILTGMGRDGASGLLKLRAKGAKTYAQNEKTSVVFGMPKEAIKLDAAMFVLSPEEIRAHLDQYILK